MPYGYGKVAFATFIGFLFGVFWEYKQPTSTIISALGYLLLAVGILSMMRNRKAVTGMAGGALAGLGLGITLASEPWFPSFVQSLGL